MAMLSKIISGGQSGVDRAALDVALELGLPCGGWCPRGRRAEDGMIDDRYPLRETPSNSYVQRTHWNIRDSDATLVINRGKLSGGTRETFDHARRIGKPVYLYSIGAPDPEERLIGWCRSHAIKTLNIAGPRESKDPGIYGQSYVLLRKLLPLLS